MSPGVYSGFFFCRDMRIPIPPNCLVVLYMCLFELAESRVMNYIPRSCFGVAKFRLVNMEEQDCTMTSVYEAHDSRRSTRSQSVGRSYTKQPNQYHQTETRGLATRRAGSAPTVDLGRNRISHTIQYGIDRVSAC